VIRILGACNLDGATSGSHAAPYAMVQIGPLEGRTKSVALPTTRDARPVWKHEFECGQAVKAEEVRVTVVDEASVGGKQVLGMVTVPLSGKWQQPAEEHARVATEWHSLKGAHTNGVARRGAIKLQLACTCAATAIDCKQDGEQKTPRSKLNVETQEQHEKQSNAALSEAEGVALDDTTVFEAEGVALDDTTVFDIFGSDDEADDPNPEVRCRKEGARQTRRYGRI
jgi:hypothetical protein